MEVINIAVQIAQAVRCTVAALKGESKLTMTCRQLMHSCQLYIECVTTLRKAVENQSKYKPSGDVHRSIEMVLKQVTSDCDLLREIKGEVEKIAKSSEKSSFLTNVMLSAITGRIESVKSLEVELMNRVQLVTALMMKDVFKATSGLDEAALETIGDVDGSIFWHGSFGTEKKVSLRTFMDAYQSYLTKTFLFRTIQKGHLLTLLRYTLIDEHVGGTGATDDNSALNAEVSIPAFGSWLRRFGPMRDTLIKASAVSLPAIGLPVPWFHKAASRDVATKIITNNVTKHANAIRPHHLIVVRYSSDPKNHFVITTKPPGSPTIEHFPVINSPKGYSVVGSTGDSFSPNLLDCIQSQIINKLFGSHSYDVELPRDSIQQWDTIFNDATVQLPADHYATKEDLDKATEELEHAEKVFGGHFDDLFAVQGLISESSSPARNRTHHTAHALADNIVIGKYMISHGMSMLQEHGNLSPDQVRVIQQILDSI